MPNWCFNNLTITGETTNVKRFVEGLKALPATYINENEPKQEVKPCYTLNSYVPVPAEVQAGGYSPDYSCQDVDPFEQVCGYNWQNEHWGTKWDAFNNEDVKAQLDEALSNLDQTTAPDADIYFGFDSAWSPICPWVIAVGVKFPDLTLELHYEGDGQEFAGVLKVQGEHVEHREYDSFALYRIIEGDVDWFEIIENFYYTALEYTLGEEGLTVIPTDSNDYEEWQSAVYDIVSTEAQEHFADVVKKTEYTIDFFIEETMKRIKTLIRS